MTDFREIYRRKSVEKKIATALAALFLLIVIIIDVVWLFYGKP